MFSRSLIASSHRSKSPMIDPKEMMVVIEGKRTRNA
jgi:hypothetical protein